MTSEERALITGLFDRLRAADAKNPSRDPEAEELIGRLTAQVPGTSYLLAQTTLVQEHALANAQTRIKSLEHQLAQAQQQAQQQRPPAQPQSGGFLAGLFGGHSTPPPIPAQQQQPPPQQQQYAQNAPPLPYPSTVGMAPAAGGGFLRGALSTAAGVAGGALLFQGIENLLGHNAGPFGPSLGGGGGFFGGGGRGNEIIENNTEVVNNYYGDEPAQHHHGGHGGDGGGIPPGVGEHPAQPGYEAAGFDDSNFDSSNPFNGPGGGLMPDQSSLDNNYDTPNPDAGDSGGFLAGDAAGNDDGGGFFGGDNGDSGSFFGGDDGGNNDDSGVA